MERTLSEARNSVGESVARLLGLKPVCTLRGNLMSWFVSITKSEWLLTEGDYEILHVAYEVVPSSKHNQPDEPQYASINRLDIKISLTLVSIWG